MTCCLMRATQHITMYGLKESLNNDGKLFHYNQQSQQTHLTPIH